MSSKIKKISYVLFNLAFIASLVFLFKKDQYKTFIFYMTLIMMIANSFVANHFEKYYNLMKNICEEYEKMSARLVGILEDKKEKIEEMEKNFKELRTQYVLKESENLKLKETLQ